MKTANEKVTIDKVSFGVLDNIIKLFQDAYTNEPKDITKRAIEYLNCMRCTVQAGE